MFSAAEILTPEFRSWERVVKRKGANCTACGQVHWEAQFKMCKTCRALHWEQLSNWRASQKKRKLCVHCVEAWGAGSIASCEYHLEYHREMQAKIRKRQSRLGRCTYSGGCQRPPAYDNGKGRGGYCETHLERLRLRDAKRAA